MSIKAKSKNFFTRLFSRKYFALILGFLTSFGLAAAGIAGLFLSSFFSVLLTPLIAAVGATAGMAIAVAGVIVAATVIGATIGAGIFYLPPLFTQLFRSIFGSTPKVTAQPLSNQVSEQNLNEMTSEEKPEISIKKTEKPLSTHTEKKSRKTTKKQSTKKTKKPSSQKTVESSVENTGKEPLQISSSVSVPEESLSDESQQDINTNKNSTNKNSGWYNPFKPLVNYFFPTGNDSQSKISSEKSEAISSTASANSVLTTRSQTGSSAPEQSLSEGTTQGINTNNGSWWDFNPFKPFMNWFKNDSLSEASDSEDSEDYYDMDESSEVNESSESLSPITSQVLSTSNSLPNSSASQSEESSSEVSLSDTNTVKNSPGLFSWLVSFINPFAYGQQPLEEEPASEEDWSDTESSSAYFSVEEDRNQIQSAVHNDSPIKPLRRTQSDSNLLLTRKQPAENSERTTLSRSLSTIGVFAHKKPQSIPAEPTHSQSLDI